MYDNLYIGQFMIFRGVTDCTWPLTIWSVQLVCFRLLLPIVLTTILAYMCVFICFLFLFSLSTIFSIVIGNIGNKCKKSLEWLRFFCFRGCCWFVWSKTIGNRFVLPMDALLFPVASYRQQRRGILSDLKSHNFAKYPWKQKSAMNVKRN